MKISKCTSFIPKIAEYLSILSDKDLNTISKLVDEYIKTG
jgi:hypothetical protein